MVKNQTVKKVFKVISNAVMYFFIALCVLLVICSITGKKTNGAINVFGHQMRVVISRSMERCDQTYDDISKYTIKDIPLKSMVFIETAPDNKEDFNKWCDGLKEGDVLTFMYTYGNQIPITHRIIDIEEDGDGGYIIKLQGDNKPTLEQEGGASAADVGTQTLYTSKQFNSTNYNYIVGKVTGQSYVLGVLVTAVSQPLGIVLIVIVPCLVIAVLEIVKIVSVLNADKKKKAQEKFDKQESEIEILKRQLAEMQKSINAQSGQSEDNAKTQTVEDVPDVQPQNLQSNEADPSAELENK